MQKLKPKSSDGRKHLNDVRVIQRHLVYIIGLPLNLADEDVSYYNVVLDLTFADAFVWDCARHSPYWFLHHLNCKLSYPFLSLINNILFVSIIPATSA